MDAKKILGIAEFCGILREGANGAGGFAVRGSVVRARWGRRVCAAIGRRSGNGAALEWEGFFLSTA